MERNVGNQREIFGGIPCNSQTLRKEKHIYSEVTFENRNNYLNGISPIPWRLKIPVLMTLTLFYLAGCTQGPLQISEQFILAAPNRDHKETNYYRVKVSGKTELGVAEFRQGWYPSDALDALFGEVTQQDSGRVLLTRQKMEKQINETILQLRKDYSGEL